MWVKAFKDQKGCDEYFIVQYHISHSPDKQSFYTIKNEKHKAVSISERSLFDALKKLFEDEK